MGHFNIGPCECCASSPSPSPSPSPYQLIEDCWEYNPDPSPEPGDPIVIGFAPDCIRAATALNATISGWQDCTIYHEPANDPHTTGCTYLNSYCVSHETNLNRTFALPKDTGGVDSAVFCLQIVGEYGDPDDRGLSFMTAYNEAYPFSDTFPVEWYYTDIGMIVACVADPDNPGYVGLGIIGFHPACCLYQAFAHSGATGDPLAVCAPYCDTGFPILTVVRVAHSCGGLMISTGELTDPCGNTFTITVRGQLA